MSVVAVVTDTHWGVRGSAREFAENQKVFWEFFWKDIDSRDDVKAILHGGDAFDKRKSIEFLTFVDAKEHFFDPASERNLDVYIIVGNHCIYYKNKNDVNSLELLLSGYPNVHIISAHPETIDISGRKIDMVPWFHHSLHDDVMEFVENSDSEVMLGHLELKGYEFHRGIVNKHGIDKKPFRRYSLVMSGHYHTKSEHDNVVYLGATSEYTWADADDPRGFHYLDLTSLDLEYIVNPHKMFYRLLIKDDTTIDSYESFQGKVIRLIQDESCPNEKFFDIAKQIELQNPFELDIIKKSETALVESDIDDDVEMKDTSDFIMDRIRESENIEDQDKEALLAFMHELYMESIED